MIMADLLQTVYESHIKEQPRYNLIRAIYIAENNNLDEFDYLLQMTNNKEMDILIQEGIFDRLKARGAGVMGSARGLYNQAIGKGQQAIGRVANLADTGLNALGRPQTGINKVKQYADTMKNRGANNINFGKKQGELTKIHSYIDNSVKNIIQDMTKLKIPIKDIANFQQQLIDVYTQNISGIELNPSSTFTGNPVKESPIKSLNRKDFYDDESQSQSPLTNIKQSPPPKTQRNTNQNPPPDTYQTWRPGLN
jgi:hypothetical protein